MRLILNLINIHVYQDTYTIHRNATMENIRNMLIFYIFHPMRMMNEKPGLFLAVLAPAVYFLGVSLGWWDNFVGELLNA